MSVLSATITKQVVSLQVVSVPVKDTLITMLESRFHEVRLRHSDVHALLHTTATTTTLCEVTSSSINMFVAYCDGGC